MKHFFAFVVAFAAIVFSAHAQQNRTPIHRGFLQDNLDANGQSITNASSVVASNFTGNAINLTNFPPLTNAIAYGAGANYPLEVFGDNGLLIVNSAGQIKASITGNGAFSGNGSSLTHIQAGNIDAGGTFLPGNAGALTNLNGMAISPSIQVTNTQTWWVDGTYVNTNGLTAAGFTAFPQINGNYVWNAAEQAYDKVGGGVYFYTSPGLGTAAFATQLNYADFTQPPLLYFNVSDDLSTLNNYLGNSNAFWSHDVDSGTIQTGPVVTATSPTRLVQVTSNDIPQTATAFVLDVRGFGAQGDGVADDTAAIQAAFDRAKTIRGCIVKFSRGTYRVTKTANDPSIESNYSALWVKGADMRVQGDPGATIQLDPATSGTCHVFWFANNNGSTIVVDGLTIDGGVTGAAGPNVGTLLDFACRSNIRVSNCILRNSREHGVDLEDVSTGLLVDHCTFQNCHVSALHGDAGSGSFHVRDCIFAKNNQMTGDTISPYYAGTYPSITQCAIDQQGVGPDCPPMQIENCYFMDNSPVDISAHYRFNISHCYFGTPNFGLKTNIFVGASVNFTITGCVFNPYDTAATIVLDKNKFLELADSHHHQATKGTITGNTFNGGKMIINDADQILISGNWFNNNAVGPDILFNGGTNCAVTANYFTSYGITLGSGSKQNWVSGNYFHPNVTTTVSDSGSGNVSTNNNR